MTSLRHPDSSGKAILAILGQFFYQKGAAHRNICSNNQPKIFQKVQRTETSYIHGYGALHLRIIVYLMATNISVRCTFS
jgi:hypothetical protein